MGCSQTVDEVSAATAMLGLARFRLLVVSSTPASASRRSGTTVETTGCRGCRVVARLHDRLDARPLTWQRNLLACDRPVTLLC